MKIIHLVILCMLSLTINAQVDHGYDTTRIRAAYEKNVFICNNSIKLPYRLLKASSGKANRPIVLFLHGAGERGNDNEICLNYIDRVFNSEKFKNLYDAHVVIPQCNSDFRWVEVDWSDANHTMPVKISGYLEAANDLLDSLVKVLNADTTRIYVTGISMGGFGTWDIISRYPHKFAAAVPVCGGADEKQASNIAQTPVYTAHGTADNSVMISRSRNVVAAVKKAGGKQIIYKEYPGKGHFIWNGFYAEPYTFAWMFKQKRTN